MLSEIDWDNCTEDDLLQPELMLELYANGAFPMAESNEGSIEWYMPKIRCIIPLDNFNFPRSLNKVYQASSFEYKVDNDFLSVINACAERKETWITPKLIAAYGRLWELGYLHTVEVYHKDTLVGGLYGIGIKAAFFGESMFSRISQASKCALIKLIEVLNENAYMMLDVQYMTEHLRMFGATEISLKHYMSILKHAYKREVRFLL